MKYPTLDGPGLAAAQIVRVIVRELRTQASETVRKRIGFCADSIGWRVLACSAFSPYEPEGREFESPRARHLIESKRVRRITLHR
jgi:hypothetical protein